MRGTDGNAGLWRPSLEQIESTVSSQLGPGRVPGNEHGPCFSRQISMYLAKHVGGWSTVKIGRFYNHRHHTTVMHALKKVQRLRGEDESVDALIEVLTAAVREDIAGIPAQVNNTEWPAELIDTIAMRILHRLSKLRQKGPESVGSI